MGSAKYNANLLLELSLGTCSKHRVIDYDITRLSIHVSFLGCQDYSLEFNGLLVCGLDLDSAYIFKYH